MTTSNLRSTAEVAADSVIVNDTLEVKELKSPNLLPLFFAGSTFWYPVTIDTLGVIASSADIRGNAYGNGMFLCSGVDGYIYQWSENPRNMIRVPDISSFTISSSTDPVGGICSGKTIIFVDNCWICASDTAIRIFHKNSWYDTMSLSTEFTKIEQLFAYNHTVFITGYYNSSGIVLHRVVKVTINTSATTFPTFVEDYGTRLLTITGGETIGENQSLQIRGVACGDYYTVVMYKRHTDNHTVLYVASNSNLTSWTTLTALPAEPLSILFNKNNNAFLAFTNTSINPQYLQIAIYTHHEVAERTPTMFYSTNYIESTNNFWKKIYGIFSYKKRIFIVGSTASDFTTGVSGLIAISTTGKDWHTHDFIGANLNSASGSTSGDNTTTTTELHFDLWSNYTQTFVSFGNGLILIYYYYNVGGSYYRVVQAIPVFEYGVSI